MGWGDAPANHLSCRTSTPANHLLLQTHILLQTHLLLPLQPGAEPCPPSAGQHCAGAAFSPPGSHIPPQYNGPTGRGERWGDGFGWTAWRGSAISPLLHYSVVRRRGRFKKIPKEGAEVGTLPGAAQPSPKHSVRPEEPGWPGRAPNPPKIAKTSPKTQPAPKLNQPPPALMLEPTSILARKMWGAAHAHGGTGGHLCHPCKEPPASSLPFISHSPARLLQVTDGLLFGF